MSASIAIKLLRRHGTQILFIITVVLLIRAFLVLSMIKSKLPVSKIELRDWHDYAQQKNDVNRVGDGEQGEPLKLKIEPTKEDLDLFDKHGFYTYLSDRISVERAVPDIRHEACRHELYSSKLPAVSVIFIFHNEYFSVLLRSIHSVINRTPKELLHEIILIDDCSNVEGLKEPLENYIQNNFPKNLIKLKRLSKKSGLMRARLTGARMATAPVLVFFDSHIETNYNWLPPLLEPLVVDRKTVTIPLVDSIGHSGFQYESQDEGALGAFDWEMNYKRVPFIQNTEKNPIKPFKTPIMAGGLFAIARDFFWNLGGYDPGLVLWGAEQYEISFKVWMCGGRMLEVPCARVGHVYRLNGFAHTEPSTQHYVQYVSSELSFL